VLLPRSVTLHLQSVQTPRPEQRSENSDGEHLSHLNSVRRSTWPPTCSTSRRKSPPIKELGAGCVMLACSSGNAARQKAKEFHDFMRRIAVYVACTGGAFGRARESNGFMSLEVQTVGWKSSFLAGRL
jgi:hypothetical protein